MSKFRVLFWIFFSIFSLLHIYFCFKEDEKARKISKCFILPLLILYLIVNRCDKILVYFGAVFGFLGDVLIIFKKKKMFFVIGSICFMLGHLFYMLQMYNIIGKVYYWHFIVFGLIFLVLAIIGYNIVFDKIGKMTIVGVIYFSFLISTLFVAITTDKPLIILGTFTFVISDVILSFVNFFKPTVKKKELYVMSTYILAQTLMILSLM